jgi:hypothetical protein
LPPSISNHIQRTQSAWNLYAESVQRLLHSHAIRTEPFSTSPYIGSSPTDSTQPPQKESMNPENQMNHSINSASFFDGQATALQERADAAKAKAKERAKEEAAAARYAAAVAKKAEKEAAAAFATHRAKEAAAAAVKAERKDREDELNRLIDLANATVFLLHEIKLRDKASYGGHFVAGITALSSLFRFRDELAALANVYGAKIIVVKGTDTAMVVLK